MWQLVEQDLLEVYGADSADYLTGRTWAWLQDKITGLLNRPKVVAPDGTLVPTTRLQWHFFPPQPKQPNSR